MNYGRSAQSQRGKRQNTLLAHYNTTTSSCRGAFWFAEITSFWLCAGGIHCVARGCCQWSIPTPGLPSSSLWWRTAQQRKMQSFINKANGSRSRCLWLLKRPEMILIIKRLKLIRGLISSRGDGFIWVALLLLAQYRTRSIVQDAKQFHFPPIMPSYFINLSMLTCNFEIRGQFF